MHVSDEDQISLYYKRYFELRDLGFPKEAIPKLKTTVLKKFPHVQAELE